MTTIHRSPHRPRRPLLGALCALVALTMTLTACTSPLGSPTSQQAAQPASALRIWYGTDDPTESAWAQTLARRFHSAHPATRVTLTTYSLDDLNTKMQLALHAGNTPDLVYTTPRGPGLPAYVRAGQLRDLSAEARRLGWASQQRPGLLATYNDTLAPNGRAGGHVYGVPYVMAGVAVLYNKAIFRRLRLAQPRTLAAFEHACAQAKASGLTPLGLGNADGWLGDDWWLTLVNATMGPATLASELRLSPAFSFEAPPLRAAAVTLQQWSTKGYFTPNFGGLDAQDSMATFFQGHTAMQLVSSTQNSQILSLARETGLRVGIFPFPSATANRAPVIPVSGYEGGPFRAPRVNRRPPSRSSTKWSPRRRHRRSSPTVCFLHTASTASRCTRQARSSATTSTRSTARRLESTWTARRSPTSMLRWRQTSNSYYKMTRRQDS